LRNYFFIFFFSKGPSEAELERIAQARAEEICRKPERKKKRRRRRRRRQGEEEERGSEMVEV
jgi:hypothetical protein